jgi:hypothetical protein
MPNSMTSLSLAERIRVMAKEVAWLLQDECRYSLPADYEAFGHAVAKMVLELEPSEAVIKKMAACYDYTWGYPRESAVAEAWAVISYRVAMQQLLKELEQ